MTKRTGIPSILKIAKTFCRLIILFTPLIRQVTNNDSSVMAALSAALLACRLLEDELEPYRVLGD